MNESKKYQNEKWLRKQYIELNKKVIDIAKECKCVPKTIHYWLRKFNFPKRKENSGNPGKKRPQVTGNDNPNWKGDNVGYYCLHNWVRRRKPKPEKCEDCGKRREYLELANISGEYKRDINDYKYLCFMCHMKFDKKWENFQKAGIKTRFKKGTPSWNKGLPKEEQPMFGKLHSEESKKKISLTKRKRQRQKLNSIFSTQQKTIEVYND